MSSKKETVEVSFTELRNVHHEVVAFTKARVDWLDEFNAQTQIEKDMGLWGLDNEEFLQAFAERFKVDFTDMYYEDYFVSEAELVNPIRFFILPFQLLFWVFKSLLGLFMFAFYKSLAKTIFKFSPPNLGYSQTKDVSLGDLMISAVQKRFVERSTVNLVLKSV